MNTSMLAILDAALEASEAEHRTKLAEQLREQKRQQAKVTADYDKRVAKLNSVIDEKKVIIWCEILIISPVDKLI